MKGILRKGNRFCFDNIFLGKRFCRLYFVLEESLHSELWEWKDPFCIIQVISLVSNMGLKTVFKHFLTSESIFRMSSDLSLFSPSLTIISRETLSHKSNHGSDLNYLDYLYIQLVLEQYGFELHRSTYMWNFFSTLLHDLRLVKSEDKEPQIQRLTINHIGILDYTEGQHLYSPVVQGSDVIGKYSID